MWDIKYSENVINEDIPQLGHAEKQRIRKAIETKLSADPLRFGKPLRHSLSHLRSLRVGDYRVLYDINHQKSLVLIISIGHRQDVYRD